MSIISTVDIQLVDENNKGSTYKLDNPKDGLTKSEVIQVFTSAINNNWLLSSTGGRVVSVGQVQLTTSEKVILQGETIYVSPVSAELTATSGTPATQTFSVTNGTVQMTELTLDAGSSGNFMNPSVTSTSNSVTVTVSLAGTPTGTVINNYTLKILVDTVVFTIPISVEGY